MKNEIELMTPNLNFAARRGYALPAGEARYRCVSVRLNQQELDKLNRERGLFKRGEYLRMCALDKAPVQSALIPEINLQAWAELARSASNLNQIAARLNAGELPIIEEIQSELARFRASLLSIDKP